MPTSAIPIPSPLRSTSRYQSFIHSADDAILSTFTDGNEILFVCRRVIGGRLSDRIRKDPSEAHRTPLDFDDQIFIPGGGTGLISDPTVAFEGAA